MTRRVLYNIQEASTIGKIEKNYHRINVALEDRQADLLSAIVEIEGIFSNHTLSLLIYPRATLS